MKSFEILVLFVALILANFSLAAEQQKQVANQRWFQINGEHKNSFAKVQLNKEQRLAAVEKFIKDRIAHGDYQSVLDLLYAKREMQEEMFKKECMKRFKSKALCITRTMSFFIWQQIEIEKLRQSIFK